MRENVLEIGKYLFTFRAAEDIHLPEYKGSTFHGGLGTALRAVSPSWFNRLFCQDGTKPYILLPPMDNDRIYPGGHTFQCELTLVGEAASQYSVCQAAFEYLGNRLGLGYRRGKFHLEGVEVASISPRFPGGECPSPVSAGEIVQNRSWLSDCSKISFHFITRLRLKDNNRLLRNAPGFPVFFARLVGRLNSLSAFYGRGELIPAGDRRGLMAEAERIELKDARIQWDDWSRFSARQKSWMKFGGLLGHITWQGDFTPFMPYLALGEWLHVGGKTSFGLGKFVMEAGDGEC